MSPNLPEIAAWTAPTVADVQSDPLFRLAVHKWLQRVDPVFSRLTHLFQPLGKYGTLRQEVLDLTGREVDVLTVSIHFDGTITLREILSSSFIQGKKLYRAQPDDVVLSRIDVHFGATAVLPEEFSEALFTNEFIIFTPGPQLNPVYVQQLLRQPYYRLETRGEASGSTGRKRLRANDLPRIKIPYFPRPVQDKIVDKYRVKLAQAERAQADIDKTRANSYVKMLQAIKLEPVRYTDPSETFTIDPAEVLSSYNTRLDVRFQAPIQRTLHQSLLRLGFLRMRDGLLSEPPLKKRPSGLKDTWDEEVPILKVRNITADEIGWDTDFVTTRTFATIDPAYRLRKGDVLVAATGKGSIGKVGLMTDKRDATVDGHVMIVRPDTTKLSPSFFLHYLRTSIGQAQFERLYVGSTGQTEFNVEDMQHFLVPPCDISKQRQVVQQMQPDILRTRRLLRRKEEIKVEAEDLFRQELLRAALR